YPRRPGSAMPTGVLSLVQPRAFKKVRQTRKVGGLLVAAIEERPPHPVQIDLRSRTAKMLDALTCGQFVTERYQACGRVDMIEVAILLAALKGAQRLAIVTEPEQHDAAFPP